LEGYLAGDVVSKALRSVDAITAQHYGRIRNDLRAIGRPVPENDLWIAAIARQHGLTLVTRDQHFQHIVGLSLEMW
jgi:tRNA(fMet)-specific endonuclease VapC